MKKIISCLLFCLLTCLLVNRVNDILVSKTYNRYYMLDKAVEELEAGYEVQVYGACHSYTSFHPPYLKENHGLDAYVFGNPGEIVPVTYLRMMEHFKVDTPKVALVEIWGLNPYETYSSQERIFEYYMPVNLERLPLSLEKLEVIRDYDALDPLLENLEIAKYKERLINEELEPYDFDYSFQNMEPFTSNYNREEMTMRIENGGFCIMPMWHDDSAYDPYLEVLDFYEHQPSVDPEDKLELEPDVVKYVEKIISLCEKYNVELIFYRAPYLSRANELRKANWFGDYCAEKGILFLDLEQEMEFDLETDFLDYHHLNDVGAKRATEFLADYILKALNG